MRNCRLYLGLFLCLSLVSLGCSVSVPLWNLYKWGSNHLAWCRFPCVQKINAGNIFKIDLSGVTSNFKELGNLKLLSVSGNSYIVENNYDIWGDGQNCQFQFGLTYTGTNLGGNCSFHELPEMVSSRPSRGQDISVWNNQLDGNLFRFKGRCTTPCTGSYEPGKLRIRIDVDKGTTNFEGFGRFEATVPVGSLTRSWTVLNKVAVSSTLGLCNVDFQFEHQAEFPVPRGSCYVV